MDIKVSNMMEYFEERLHFLDLRRNTNYMGKQPEYPMLVVFLGTAAIHSYKEISSKLFRLWPSYRDVLKFMGVEGTRENIKYYQLSTGDEGEARRESLQEDEIQRWVFGISNRKNNFRYYNKRLVYFVMATTEFADISEYKDWINIYLDVKQEIGAEASQFYELFVLLLDEKDKAQRRKAREIRNYIADKRYVVSRTVLLSNVDNDNGINADWLPCYAIVSNVIALTNNSDNRIFSALFHPDARIVTASYVCEKKPIREIGWVVVTKIIEHLEEIKGREENSSPFQDDALYDRLGLTGEHTFKILDSYAERKLFQLLPEEEQLHFFPKMEDMYYEDMKPCTPQKFNEITMNSWSCYLEQVMKKADDKIEGEPELIEQWARDYGEYIKSVFTVDELVIFAENIDKINSIFSSYADTTRSGQILEAARQDIKSRLSSNQKVRDAFIGAIRECGLEAKEFLEKWGQMLDSVSLVHPVTDRTIINFYGWKTADYFDLNVRKISGKLKEISDIKGLEAFLKKLIEDVIDSDPAVFLAPFDQERIERLSTEEHLFGEAYRDIQTKLTDREKIMKYLNVNFSFQAPIASAVMMKVGTPLEKSVREAFEDEIYFYNTGSSNSAEVIELYNVEPYHLMQD